MCTIVVVVVVVQLLSRVRLFRTPWTVACQAPLSMGFHRPEYWNELPFPPPVVTQNFLITLKINSNLLLSPYLWVKNQSKHICFLGPL